jgi:Ca2+-dependent lipid-binding protein
MVDKPVNSNCYIEFQIAEANFLRDDGDLLGKQDPFARFMHNGVKFQTKTHQDAGKQARFGEVFKLGAIEKAIAQNETLVVETLDEDVVGADSLGAAQGLQYTELIKGTEKQTATYGLLKGEKKTGEVVVCWQYYWAEPDPVPEARDPDTHPLNKRCKMEVTVVEAKFLKDHDAIGKMDPYITFKYDKGEMRTAVA